MRVRVSADRGGGEARDEGCRPARTIGCAAVGWPGPWADGAGEREELVRGVALGGIAPAVDRDAVGERLHFVEPQGREVEQLAS